VSADELMMGYFFTFIYQDFILREVVINLKWHFIKSNHFSIDDPFVRMDLRCDEFMQERFTEWMGTLLTLLPTTNIFQPYSKIVLPRIPRIKVSDSHGEEMKFKLIECQLYQILLQKYLKIIFENVPLFSNFIKANQRIQSVFTHSFNYKVIIEHHLLGSPQSQ
jgi:hypothetical protein